MDDADLMKIWRPDRPLIETLQAVRDATVKECAALCNKYYEAHGEDIADVLLATINK